VVPYREQLQRAKKARVAPHQSTVAQGSGGASESSGGGKGVMQGERGEGGGERGEWECGRRGGGRGQ